MNDIVASMMSSAAAGDGKPAKPKSLKEVVRRVILAQRGVNAMKEELNRSVSPGAIARDAVEDLISVICMRPFEVVVKQAIAAKLQLDCEPNMIPFPGFYRAFIDYSARHGTLSLFRGTLPSLIEQLISDSRPSIYVSDEQQFEDQSFEIVSSRIGRGFLHLLCDVAAYPFNFLSTRMAVAPPDAYHNMFQAISSITKEEGYLALYKGFSITLLQSVLTLVQGSTVGSMLSVIYPLHMLQASMQLHTGPVSTPWNVADELYSKHGASVFGAGLTATLWWLPWATGFSWLRGFMFTVALGKQTHDSPRTVPQRSRTLLRRWLSGETVAERRRRKAPSAKSSKEKNSSQ